MMKYDENIKVKNVLLCDKGQNLYNTDEKIRGDNKDMNNITNEQNKSCNNFMINNNIFSKNENIDDNISIFTSSIKENIPNTKEVIEKKKKPLFGDLFMDNKESDLSKIFINEKNSIKIPHIENKGDLFGNTNIINNNDLKTKKIKNIYDDNKISIFNKDENFDNLSKKEISKEKYIEFEIIYKPKENRKIEYEEEEKETESDQEEFEEEEIRSDDEGFENEVFKVKEFENKNFKSEKSNKAKSYEKKEHREKEFFPEISNRHSFNQSKIKNIKILKLFGQKFISNNKDM